MKKLLASLLVLAMCAPAMAISFTTADLGGGVLQINYNLAAGEGLRGLALTLDVTAGDAVVAGSTAFAAPAFNTFIDYAYTTGATYTVGTGHPFALKTAAGVATFPANSFALSLGYLDQAAGQAAITTSGSITVTFTKVVSNSATVAVALDPLRGGAVGDALVAATGLPASQVLTFAVPQVNLTVATTYGGTVTDPGIGVFAKDQGSTANLVAGAPIANFIFWKWTGATVANPAAASTTILMDAAKSVTANFSLTCQNWNLTKKKGGLTDNFVNAQDVSNLITYVNANKPGAGFSVPSTAPGYSIDYNFTKLMGGTDNFINAQDLSALINWVNSHKAGTGFSVACLTCGC